MAPIIVLGDTECEAFGFAALLGQGERNQTAISCVPALEFREARAWSMKFRNHMFYVVHVSYLRPSVCLAFVRSATRQIHSFQVPCAKVM